MRGRGQRLSPETVRLLAEKFPRYGNQYLIFSEFQGLNDASITRFLEVVDVLDHISNVTLRANALGIFQANVGLWQILARQGQISPEDLNDSWQKVIGPFASGICFLGPAFRRGPSLDSRSVAVGSGQDRIFPRAKSSLCWRARISPILPVNRSGRSWPAGFARSWTVNAWFLSTRCWRWATA